MTPYRRRSIAVVFCLTAACASWRVETVSPRRLIEDERPRSVRVVLKDSSVVLIADPVMRSDSIAGEVQLMMPGVAPSLLRPIPVAVALRDVGSIAVSRVDTRKTLMWLIPTGIGIGGAIILIS